MYIIVYYPNGSIAYATLCATLQSTSHNMCRVLQSVALGVAWQAAH